MGKTIMSDKDQAASVSSSISSFKANRPSKVVISVNKELTFDSLNAIAKATMGYLDPNCKACGFNGMDFEIRYVNPVTRYYGSVEEVVDVALV